MEPSGGARMRLRGAQRLLVAALSGWTLSPRHGHRDIVTDTDGIYMACATAHVWVCRAHQSSVQRGASQIYCVQRGSEVDIRQATGSQIQSCGFVARTEYM